MPILRTRFNYRKPHSPRCIVRRERLWQLIQASSLPWYVYAMWRYDWGAPVPFYVGKGRGYRAMHHELPSMGGNSPHKQRVIGRHQRRGWWIGYTIAFYSSEQAAFAAEKRLIAKFGRRNRSTGVLTNLTDGGDGTAGHIGMRGDTNHKARPVIAGGERYSCIAYAADALGISRAAVICRIKRGWPGFYYEDEGQRPVKGAILQRYRREIHVLGKVYPSLSEAARKTGIGFRQISRRALHGWPGYFYTDEGQQPYRSRSSTQAASAPSRSPRRRTSSQ